MSKTIYENATAGIYVGRYCGPDDGSTDRQRWQVMCVNDGVAVLTRRQIADLADAILDDSDPVERV